MDELATDQPVDPVEGVSNDLDVDARRSNQSIELVPAVSDNVQWRKGAGPPLFSPDTFLPENKISPP